MSVNFKMQVKPCATRVPNFNSPIITNKLFMVEERELTYSNCIKIWDKIAI